MAISFKRFSYLSERAKGLKELIDNLELCKKMNDHETAFIIEQRILFESRFFPEYVSSLLTEVHIQRASSRDI